MPDPATGRAPRNLVLWSDGTGNSSAKLMTNVRRLSRVTSLVDEELCFVAQTPFRGSDVGIMHAQPASPDYFLSRLQADHEGI